MTNDWSHYTVGFTDPASAEQIAAADLGPSLIAAQDAGTIHGWWYIRKREAWRLRCSHDPESTAVSDLLDNLAAEEQITGWTPGIYEPETTAFGGTQAMDIAHHLFCHDSRHLLIHAAAIPTRHTLGRRETSAMLCSVLLRGAGLDWYEQGDVWAKVAELRPAAPATAALPPERTHQLANALRQLMTVDAHALCDPAKGALSGYGQWVAAFEDAGRALAQLARQGQLRRGLRAILAHHVIFHANRAGLSLADQSTLAALALNSVFADSGEPVSLPPTPRN